MDKRALKILFDTYWSSAGWKGHPPPPPPLGDFAYAKARGVMFEPVRYNHSEWNARLIAARENVSLQRVVDAFLASLSTRRLDWRSALGSFAVFRHFSAHEPVVFEGRCKICGEYVQDREDDLSILNFERWKWGGVRHDQVTYGALDLELFAGEKIPPPTAEDVTIFQQLIGAISTVPKSVTSATLQSHFPKGLKSNKAERDVIVGLLGFCGILKTPGHPDYSEAFVPDCERELPDRRFVDMHYPACWWSAEDGLDRGKLREYFGHILIGK